MFKNENLLLELRLSEIVWKSRLKLAEKSVSNWIDKQISIAASKRSAQVLQLQPALRPKWLIQF